MEFIPEGNLRHMVCEQKTLVVLDLSPCVMTQLLDALKYLHNLGVVHRGIRLDNLMVVSKQPLHIKLTGFEFSSYNGNTCSFPVVGHQAPELWERSYRSSVAPFIWNDLLSQQGVKERPLPICGQPVDIWSAGVVCSELTLSTVPHYVNGERSSDEQAADYISLLLDVGSKNLMGNPELWAARLKLPFVPLLLLQFLQKLLNLDPEARAEADECLSDPWPTMRARSEQPEEHAAKRRKLNRDSIE